MLALQYLIACLGALLLPVGLAQSTTSYWPILTPSASTPWVVGQKNLLSWRCASDTGVEAFDVELLNVKNAAMSGAIRIAFRVPNTRLTTGYRNYGGEIEVDLDAGVPTGDGFVVAFVEKVHGQVYTISSSFSILASAPDNYTANPDGLPDAGTSATLTGGPDPTMEWAITMSGAPLVTTSPS